MTKQERDQLKKLVANNKIQQAIEKLLQFNLAKDERNEIITAQARHNNLLKKIRLGTISTADQNLKRNNITTTLLNQIDIVYEYVEDGDTTKLITQNDGGSGGRGWIVILGVLGSMASIISLLYMCNPDEEETKVEQLTVFVTDEKGNVVLENVGEINIPIGFNTLNSPIGNNGETDFDDIPAKYKGDSITIGLKAEGWEIDGTNQFLFTGKPIKLKVKRDDSLGWIKGLVMTRDGQQFIEEAKITINADTSIYTNREGFFGILLPENMRIKKVTDRYRLTVSKEGYQTITQYYQTKSSPADIRLELKLNP